ncbi:hypothetical protein ABT56_10875 [Photobacterium aquae]|uniref:Outer membrane protein beta-barrel domain-containing protein n=1 Tax=Photobacterium aquae TaxID=1195763 RepID=A0A0J1H2J1_9GAMM|nr:outer membrane beta-barrel protein [Photobacterium aquae]KLV06015.1 hypothetical protein ABT56_10875 [Photobacterium aquae]
MKRLLLLACFSPALFASPSADNLYIGAVTGFSYYEHFTFPLTFGLTVGYQHPLTPNYSLAIEVEGTEVGNGGYFKNWKYIDYQTYSWGLNVKPKYHFHIGHKPSYVAGIAGIHKMKETRSMRGDSGEYQKFKDYSMAGLAGFEIGSRMTDKLDLIASIKYRRTTLFDENNNYLSYNFGIQYNF